MKKFWMLIVIASFWGCIDQTIEEEEVPVTEDEKFAVQAPADFNWSCITSTGITVNFKNNGSITNALDNTLVELYDDEEVLLDALTIIDGVAEFNVRIPSSVEKLNLKVAATGEAVQIDAGSSMVDYVVSDISALAFNKTDMDKDGLADIFDANPNNAKVAVQVGSWGASGNLKSSQKKVTSSASYAIFEDLWPSKGDYDFNDLVVKTTFSWTRGKSNYIEQIDVVCGVEWIGASLELGLGFELFEAKGTNLYYLGEVITNVEGATEDDAVRNGVIAFARVQNVGTNDVSFSVTLKDKEFKEFVFVPYLYRTNDPSHQVRPFGAPPTQAQDMDMFRSHDDASPRTWSWEAGKKFKYPLSEDEAFYRSKENHPWGIEFITNKKFKPCRESITIVKEYPTFKNWAESGGHDAQDWYENHI
ncbi:LruC domain-containing protein [uncultured Draconibacterium sp.]|uniref:LruC domain-containing protein n=1 Tax=uncultured Draconibacterium sp. TaxID=1573823 RepID=UPI0032606FBB